MGKAKKKVGKARKKVGKVSKEVGKEVDKIRKKAGKARKEVDKEGRRWKRRGRRWVRQERRWVRQERMWVRQSGTMRQSLTILHHASLPMGPLAILVISGQSFQSLSRVYAMDQMPLMCLKSVWTALPDSMSRIQILMVLSRLPDVGIWQGTVNLAWRHFR